METLGELVARDRRSDAVAIRTDPADRSMSYHDCCTTAWKAGNFLRYLGVRAGDRVLIAADPAPEPVLALFGGALLGATVEFAEEPDGGARVVLVPADREGTVDPSDGTRLLVYGGEPDSPRVAHWEGEVWSENPAFPPTEVDPDTPALSTGMASFTHRELLDAADGVVARHEMGAETTVAVRESLAHPGAVVAGVLAPLSTGATVVFPDRETDCDVSVGVGPEPITIDPESVTLSSSQ